MEGDKEENEVGKKLKEVEVFVFGEELKEESDEEEEED